MEPEINEELVLKVVRILVGPITPAADTAIDGKRLENLRVMCKVVDKLLYDIKSVSDLADSHFNSVKIMAGCAEAFLKEVKEAD